MLKTRAQRYVDEREIGLKEKVLRYLHALADEFIIDGATERGTESALEHAARYADERCDFVNPHTLASTLADQAQGARDSVVLHGKDIGGLTGADGVYTFHAPREFIIPDVDPGYDLRVIVDGEEWWPAMRWHALGTWSRALAKGPHQFRVIFVDTRTKPYKHETWQNWPNLDVLWKGETPMLEVSGPGINQHPIPAAWLRQVK